MVRRLWYLPFPLLAGVVGTAYTFGDPVRYTSATFDPATALAPMPVWGLVFLMGAAVLTLTLALGQPSWLVAALIVGGGIYTFWATCYLVAAVTEPTASLAGWAKELCLALTHYYAAYRVHHDNPRTP